MNLIGYHTIINMLLKRRIRIIIDAFFKERKVIKKTDAYLNLVKSNKKKRIILLMTPEYGNLGDHAIAYSILDILNKSSVNLDVIEITQYHLKYNFKDIIKNININDIIVITGGGYFGNLWKYDGEFIVRSIINKLPNNKIIIFPMTMYFEDNELGRKELNLTQKIYSKHRKLYICCREKRTYNLIMNEGIAKVENVFLFPDVVFNLKVPSYKKKEYAILCMRNDKEKKENINIELLIEYIKEKTGLDVKIINTRIDKTVKPSERESELVNKFKEFSEAKLVVTDRLHGMIFSYISHTPCIVFDNLTKKISGVHEWIEDEKSVQTVSDDLTELTLKEICSRDCRFPKDFHVQFDELKKLVNNVCFFK